METTNSAADTKKRMLKSNQAKLGAKRKLE
jgi:hypothetical protein